MTLRHDVKTYVGDSWSSPTWAVILPGGLGVDLADGWTVTAQVRADRKAETPLHTYTTANGGVVLGTATVSLSNGTSVETSTVELAHPRNTTWPVFVGPWDCEIRKGTDSYTIVEGTYRTLRDVTQ